MSDIGRYLPGLALALLTALPLRAETPLTYTDGGRALFTIEMPDFWQLRSGGLRALSDPATGQSRTVSRLFGLRPAAPGGIWMGLLAPAGVRDIEGGLAYLRDIGPFLVSDPVVESRAERRIGERPATTLSGSGRRDGRAVSFTAALIQLPNARVAVAVVVMEAGLDPALIEDVNAVFASFRAVP